LDERPTQRKDSEDPASGYLSALNEENMHRAWGEGKTLEERRRIVSAAIIFGHQFEERMQHNPPEADETSIQRFLMAIMNAAISEFAHSEAMSEEAASEFLSDVGTRDYVLEFNEVLEEYHSDESNRGLNELLGEAVENRRERAIWAQHWSSG
jgi:hypothetical protein